MNPYETVGVNEDATKEEITRKYRKAAMSKHPDVGGSEDEFIKLNKAYALLSDPGRRAAYDETGATEEQGPDQITTEAKNKIMVEMDRMIEDRQRTILQDDIIKMLTEGFEEVIGLTDNQLFSNTGKLEYLSKLRGKMTVKKGNNLFDNLLDTRTKNIKQANHRIKHDQKVFKRALELLKDYTYNFDKPDPRPIYLNTATSTGTAQQQFAANSYRSF